MNEDNPYVLVQYFLYLSLSMSVTWAVGRTLHKNGAVFLVDAFKGRETLAASVNHLLVVGFYLVNFGWVIRGVRVDGPVWSFQGVIENICQSLGTVLLLLGVMHFANIYIFNRMRNRSERPRHELPPVRPSEFLNKLPVAQEA